MKHIEVKSLPNGKFRRLTGVKRSTYNQMVEILIAANNKRRIKASGRNKKLCIQDQLLMTLEYLREYRTYFHIGKSYGLSESSAYKTIKWVEDVLVKDPLFALPGKKSLLKTDFKIETVLIDATESPIERPKKSKNTIIQAKRNDTL